MMLIIALVALFISRALGLGSVVIYNGGCLSYILYESYIDGVEKSSPGDIRPGLSDSIPFSSAQSDRTMFFSPWPPEGSDKKKKMMMMMMMEKRQDPNWLVGEYVYYMPFSVTLSDDGQTVTYGFLPGNKDDIFSRFGYSWRLGSTAPGAIICNSFDGCEGIQAPADSDVVFSTCNPYEGEVELPDDSTPSDYLVPPDFSTPTYEPEPPASTPVTNEEPPPPPEPTDTYVEETPAPEIPTTSTSATTITTTTPLSVPDAQLSTLSLPPIPSTTTDELVEPNEPEQTSTTAVITPITSSQPQTPTPATLSAEAASKSSIESEVPSSAQQSTAANLVGTVGMSVAAALLAFVVGALPWVPLALGGEAV